MALFSHRIIILVYVYELINKLIQECCCDGQRECDRQEVRGRIYFPANYFGYFPLEVWLQNRSGSSRLLTIPARRGLEANVTHRFRKIEDFRQRIDL